ncbi:MAG: acyl-CoA dehydrogenase family protein [Actinomycetota bacterium]|nr:acyl-CoA dehydrogenase family protein [Actinomycetota bacterium]
MDFEYSTEEKAFQREVRAFIEEQRSPGVMDPTREGMAQLVDTPERRRFMKAMADRGWLGMSWPAEYGGGAAPGIYEYLLNEELAAAGAPLIGKGVGIVGKTIIRHGNERLKSEFLPKILNAEIEFAIGYSEPNAGSDLASLVMRATLAPEGKGWILNGQKRFTTSAHFADWYWVAARTDPDAPKHKGITLFLVPMNAPGITIQAMDCIGDNERTNEVFLDNVFVGDDYVVGEVDKGWYYISEALDFERFTLFTISTYVKKYEVIRDWIREATRDGSPLKDDPHVRRTIAWLATQIEIAKMHTLRVISKAGAGGVPNLESAMFKLFTTQLGQKITDEFLTIAGAQGALRRDTPGAPLNGRMENYYRYSVIDTVGAGTSEVQRNIIARRGLGLPVEN